MPVSNTASLYEGIKIEQVLNSVRLKRNLLGSITPVTLVKNSRLNEAAIKSLVTGFLEEFSKKYTIFSNVSSKDFLNCFAQGARNLLEYYPDKISVELSASKSIYFFAKIAENNIYYEVFFLKKKQVNLRLLW